MPSPATCRLASPDERIAAQRAAIARFEAALWDGGFDESLLPSYQSAWRRLETLIAARGADRRHHFVVVIPVADSPQQLRACLDSLLDLCNLYGYGGQRGGRWQKISVMIADDTRDPALIGAHRAIAREFDARGLDVHVFGLDEQRALLAALPGTIDLSRIVGDLFPEDFSHKGQAIMRNIAWLKLARMKRADAPLLFYTLDADQTFRVKVATADGDRDVCAVNFLAQLDAIFSATDAEVLTGKVVGDPPVSPAAMAGNFLEDVAGFLREMAGCDPRHAYRQPGPGTRGAGEAAYHDMAVLFGFRQADAPHRYRCTLDGSPSNAMCFDDFSRHLSRFFHGGHPTRVIGYRHAGAMPSVQPARTVYTGNAVFRASALNWFIPFAPLRLRMSGPTLGRLMKAELGARFVSANLPMLHKRTVDATGQSEFRPGVVAERERIDLCDEFERQFHGDVMLFSIERLTGLGYPRHAMAPEQIAATLESVQADVLEKYRVRRAILEEKLGQMQALLDDPDAWWNHAEALDGARANFQAFADNIAHNFGAESPCHARIESADARAAWRTRQLHAIAHYRADRHAWDDALAALTQP
ncbi:MAG: hypothetical protein M1449_04485 [Candidatus Thermoplasmatota archaeon]|nr:hypothetical protein [Candidatus Thermoplasmatota archaeon]